MIKSKEYRDNLAHDLKLFRSGKYGEKGRELAETLLAKEKETEEYKEAKEIHLNEIKSKLGTKKQKSDNAENSDIDDKPGKLIGTKINRAGSLLETRIINIDGVEIKYLISITKKGEGIVDDCQIRDSFKIEDPDIIKKFISTVIFSYPDLINKRAIIHEEGMDREQEIKDSFYREWLAHNYVYYLSMCGNTEKEMINPKIKNSRAYKYLLAHRFVYFLRESTRHVDLDINRDSKYLTIQKLYEKLGKQYLKMLKKKKNQY